jgi:hypothetical protein
MVPVFLPKAEIPSVPATPTTVTLSEDSNMTTATGVVTASVADNTDTDSDNITIRSEATAGSVMATHDSDTEVCPS